MVFMVGKKAKLHRFLIGLAAIAAATLVFVLAPAGEGIAAKAVRAKAAQKASLSEKSLSLSVGEKQTLFVDGMETGDSVTFKTSDKKIATVAAGGLVTAKKKGEAKITATVTHLNGKTDTFKCTVSVTKGKDKTALKYKDINTKDELVEALSSGKGGAFRMTVGARGIYETIPVLGDVVLDLNGTMVRGATEHGLFMVTKGGSFTITDSAGNDSGFIMNTGKGGIVDCMDGTLVLESGSLLSDGDRVIFSQGTVIMNGSSLSGGSVSTIYADKGKVEINGGYIGGTNVAVIQKDGVIVINDTTIEATTNALVCEGGTAVIGGGSFSNTLINGSLIMVKGGTVLYNGGQSSYSSAGINVDKGCLFFGGGEVAPCGSDDNTYGIYSSRPESAQITINGGSVKASYAGIFLQEIPDGSVVINGGSIESTGDVGITAKDCALTINGGKIKGTSTACSVNCETGGRKVKIKGGTFTGDNCLIIIGKPDVSIEGGVYKSDSYGLIINSSFSGKLNKYDSSLFKKVLDQRKGGEKNSSKDGAGYRRIDVKYREDMLVEDVSTLYSLVCISCEQLIPTLKLRMTPELFDVLRVYTGKDGNWLWTRDYMGYQETSSWAGTYSYTMGDSVYNYTINWDFGWEHQINSIAADPSVYSKADKEVRKYSDKIDEILDGIITKKMTDVEKVKAVHDYMCEHYSYAKPAVETGPGNDHTFHAMLDDATGVCQAYATLFHVMMLKLGIKDETVTGMATSLPWGASKEAHMWNRVCIDNEWLYIDVTWDDGGADDKYLLKNEKDFYSDGTHFPDA